MSLIEGFTRPETLATETTSNRFQYLEMNELVIPERISRSCKPTVIYTWEQILEIRAIKHLRQEISLQAVRKIVEFLGTNLRRDKKDDGALRRRLFCPALKRNPNFSMKVDSTIACEISSLL
jgi:DNA-binding transcriptional MerR regulator